MTAFVTLDSATFRTPEGRTLFDNLSLSFGPERTALVGRNGAGKTSLISLILGELTPISGSVSRHGRIAALRQGLAPAPGSTVADLLGVADDLARLDRLGAGDGDEADLAAADWMLPDRLQAELSRVGLGGVDLARPRPASAGARPRGLRWRACCSPSQTLS
jgi:ATPase subunit of ABC transporter with duplicated ATPase domains